MTARSADVQRRIIFQLPVFTDLDQLERHIHWESDINALLPNGQYPLHVAAEKGRIIMVKTLLKHGAGIDRETAEGDTALDLAILTGRTQIAEILLDAGRPARVDRQRIRHQGALALAGGRDRAPGLAIDESVLKRMDTRNLFCYLDIINRLRGQPKGSFNVQLTLETLLIDWAEGLARRKTV